MNTCKTCKWWSEANKELWRGDGGDCACEKFVYEGPLEPDGLTYWDAENYDASFRTGPDFGCIHWEKEEHE